MIKNNFFTYLYKNITKNNIFIYLFYIIIFIILFIIIIQAILCIIYIYHLFKKYFFTKEINFKERYGENTWVLITGCSSGQGKLMALEFAQRGFNIILMGSDRIKNVEKIIKEKYKVQTRICIVDFCKAYEKDFFVPITNILNEIPGELSILVNNVAHRVAWKSYDKMPSEKINDSIICGTIVQARLTQIGIQQFLKRKSVDKYKSAIINITAMCNYSNIWFGVIPDISVPYLSVYEGANAFGYYHSNSIHKEYGKMFDILNIPPGAVVTENTQYLKDIPFCIDSDIFVKNIFKLIGNYNGIQFADWKHDISNILCNFMFFYKDKILEYTGNIIALNYMKTYNSTKI